jgi:DNA-binding NarL/FixJ family response regulator
MPDKTSVFFVEDNEVVRFKLKSILGRIKDFQIIGEAEDGQTAIERILELKPSIALIDIGLPIVNGIEVARQVKKQLPETHVIMLTASDSESDIFAALDVGAEGYVLKGDFSKTVETAIRSARVGAVWLDPGIAKHVLHLTHQVFATATERTRSTEEEILSANEHAVLKQVANANCEDGVCLVDPAFLRKLKRFSSSETRIPVPELPEKK